MTFEENRLYDAIAISQPIPEVACALDDDPVHAGIVTENDPNGLVGSRLLNVATAAMDSLRRLPERPVIEKELDIEEPEDWLGKYVVRLLNDSLRRPFYPRHPQFRSEEVHKLGTCALAEEKFLEAAVPDPESPSLYFINSQGNIVMFKKDSGEPSTVTTKPIQINGVRYPAGVLLSLDEYEEAQTELISGFRITTLDPANIEGIAPLRFTTFAFRPEHRRRYFEPIDGYAQDNLEYLDNSSSFSDLTPYAPDKRTLMDAYAVLHLGTDDIE